MFLLLLTFLFLFFVFLVYGLIFEVNRGVVCSSEEFFSYFFFFFCFDFGLDAEKSVEPEEDLRFDCF